MQRILVILLFFFQVHLAFASTPMKSEVAIDQQGIRKVFIDHQKELQSCYESALTKNKSSATELEGNLVLDFDIAQDGSIARIELATAKSSLTDSTLFECLKLKILGWTFPRPPGNKTVQVFYPLTFFPKKK